jgi:hypothetical protein
VAGTVVAERLAQHAPFPPKGVKGSLPLENPRLDPTVEAWAQTLEQVMTAAAESLSANGDVRRARIIRQVRGRLVPRARRG